MFDALLHINDSVLLGQPRVRSRQRLLRNLAQARNDPRATRVGFIAVVLDESV